jgi:hypothetical protein
MLLSVNQISELTGRDRHGIPKRLENLPFTPGDKGAHLYESREALPLVYAVDNSGSCASLASPEPSVLERGARGRSTEAAHADSDHRDVIDETFQAIGSMFRRFQHRNGFRPYVTRTSA